MTFLKKIFLTAATVIICASCADDKRENILQCVSQDKTYVATFYREFGGGAAGWQTESVSVRRVDGGKEKQILEMSHGYDVILTWITPLHLEITYPDSARVIHWESHFEQKFEGTKLINGITVLKPLQSKEGSFVGEATRCGRS